MHQPGTLAQLCAVLDWRALSNVQPIGRANTNVGRICYGFLCQAVAEDQLKRELSALSAAHTAELQQLEAAHAAVLADRAAALDEVTSVLSGEVEAVRTELLTRQEM